MNHHSVDIHNIKNIEVIAECNTDDGNWTFALTKLRATNKDGGTFTVNFFGTVPEDVTINPLRHED